MLRSQQKGLGSKPHCPEADKCPPGMYDPEVRMGPVQSDSSSSLSSDVSGFTFPKS